MGFDFATTCFTELRSVCTAVEVLRLILCGGGVKNLEIVVS